MKLAREIGGSKLILEWLEEARSSGRLDCYSGKRQCPRIQWSAGLEIHLPTGSGQLRSLNATSREISESGMSFTCRQPIPAYTDVEICLDGTRQAVLATVIHCTQSLGTHVIGVEFKGENESIKSTRMSAG